MNGTMLWFWNFWLVLTFKSNNHSFKQGFESSCVQYTHCNVMKLERSKAECYVAREGWALFSAGASGRIQSEALEEKGVGSGQGDLSKDYTPYLNNKGEHWNTWAPPGISSSHRCPLGRINGNHSGQNTVSSLSSLNDFSASAVADGLFTAGRDLLVINSVKNACARPLCKAEGWLCYNTCFVYLFMFFLLTIIQTTCVFENLF